MSVGQSSDIEVGFRITEHPFLRYRKEDRIDLEHAWTTDILQGAFMGDVILRLPGADFGTSRQDSGWRGLVEWCLHLDAAVRAIGEGAAEHQMSEPDSDEHICIRREGSDLVVSWTRSDATARVPAEAFVQVATTFLRERVAWIGEEYPAAKRNQAASYIWKRLNVYV